MGTASPKIRCGHGECERLSSSIWRVHPNLISWMQVQFCKKLSSMQFLQQLLNDWNGEFIFHSFCVQEPVIHTKSPRTISFLNQQNESREKRLTRLDDAFLQHLCTFPFKFLLWFQEFKAHHCWIKDPSGVVLPSLPNSSASRTVVAVKNYSPHLSRKETTRTMVFPLSSIQTG